MPQEEPLLTEHHILPVLRYKLNSSGAYITAEAGTAFTFGEGTVVTTRCVAHEARRLVADP